MLEEIRIQLIIDQCLIRFYIICEFFDFNLVALFSSAGFTCFRISACGVTLAPMRIVLSSFSLLASSPFAPQPASSAIVHNPTANVLIHVLSLNFLYCFNLCARACVSAYTHLAPDYFCRICELHIRQIRQFCFSMCFTSVPPLPHQCVVLRIAKFPIP